MGNFKDIIIAFFKLIFPIHLLFILVLILIGSVYSWEPAKKGLEQYVDETPILVGFNFSLRASAKSSSQSISMEYILWPSVISDPKTVIISKTDNKKAHIYIRHKGFLAKLIWLFVSIIGIWFFWFKVGQRKRQAKAKNYNNPENTEPAASVDR